MTQGKLNSQCPFMTGIDMVSCSALKEVYVPSSYELAEFCRNTMNTMCSRYMKRKYEIQWISIALGSKL